VLLIYTNKITNRLQYIFEHLFDKIMGLELTLTTNKDTFVAFEGAKLNYSNRQFTDELFFYATPLLFERGIKKQRIKINFLPDSDTPIFFINKNNSDLPFDPFAASFYLISRYEEYDNSPRDKHGRYQAEYSLAYKNGFLHIPVIDRYVQLLQAALLKRYPALPFKQLHYYYMPTYDIDIAYAYKCKGVLRNVGGYLSSVSKGEWALVKDRTLVLLGKRKDPFDTYAWQFEMHEKYQLAPLYFFLVGEYGYFDKNISLQDLRFQSLIRTMDDKYEVGLHPSYASNTESHRFDAEVDNLSSLLKRPIVKSRQHYLKLHLPDTYQTLLEHDIEEDHTMGYSSQVGFRAGTSRPFYFYDLTLEVKTHLKVVPFAFMDVSLHDYLQLSPKRAIEALKPIIKNVQEVNGQLVSLWHNNNLSQSHGWEGWLAVYEKVLQMATSGVV